MSAFSKGLIAAVVAVRTGRVAPDVAAKLVLEADSEDDLFVGITNAASLAALDDDVDDPFSGGTVAIAPMDIDTIIEGLKSGDLDTSPLGLDEQAKDSLKKLQVQDVDDAERADAVKNTLLSLVPSENQRAQAVSSNDDTLQARSVTTMRPSTRSLEKLGAPDRYKIRKEHARGGMGRILIARDNVVGREVALKELLPEISSGASVPPGSIESQGITERFLREAKITGQLEHPNIVTVYEIGKHKDGSIYYTMKFVHGETMSRRLNDIQNNDTLNEPEKLAARIRMLDSFADVCNAIAFAHSRHVIHRDLKPDNIMIGEFGETVVLDWGLARVQGQEDEAAEDLKSRSRAISDSLLHGDSANLTLDGSVVGTPAYMAPEQARGKLDEIDERTDVYALGAVLYQILSGRPPYEGPSAGLIVQQVLAGPPIRLKSIAPNVPPELINLVERAMAQDKSQRFASARELASEVQAFRDGRTLASYSYSAMENIKRWANRHKAQVLTAALAISIIITGTVYSMVELRKGKQEAEQNHRSALVAKKEAEASSELAKNESKAASEARAEAEFEAGRAAVAAQEAKDAKGEAEIEAARSNELLDKLRFALAEDYAARVQFSQGRGDYNSAYAYAAACLKTIDHPRARGAIMSDGQVIPRVWQFEPDELATQDIHEFYALAVSPDSKLVATGNNSGQIIIWNLQTGLKVQTLKVEGKQVFSVTFHPSEPILVAATVHERLLRFKYSLKTLEFKQDGEGIDIGGLRATSLEFSPDGTTLAMGGDRLTVWNWPELSLREIPKTNDYMPMIARYSPDGTKLATTSLLPSLAFGDVSIWDISAGKMKRRTIPSNRWELFSAWSPDSKKIATAGFGGEITIRDTSKMASKGIVLRGHTSTVLQVTYSPSGKYIASASADGTVRLWSTYSGRSIAQLSGFPSWIQSVLFDPGETLLLLRDIRGRISVWDIRDFDRNSLRAHKDDVMGISYNKAGDLIATASIDGTISLISAKTREVVQTLGSGAEPFLSVAFLPGQKLLLAGNTRGLYVFEYGGPARSIERPRRIINQNAAVLGISVSDDGTKFAYINYARVWIHDAKSFEVLCEIKLGKFALSCAFSPDGSEIAAGCRDGGVVFGNVVTGETRSYSVAGKSVFSLDYSNDGKLVALATEANGVFIFDVEKQATVKTLAHPSAVFGIDFSADGKLLFSGSQDRLVRVFDTSDWRLLAVLSGPESVVTRVAVNPNSTQVVAGSQDDTVRFWSLGNLFAERQNLLTIAEGKTGLTVDDESLAVEKLESWPMVNGQISRVVKSVRARSKLDIEAVERRFIDQYENFRFKVVEGKRKYLPSRKKDAFGSFAGKPQGEVDHLSWWMGQLESTPPSWFWRKAFLTELTEDGQAQQLGLESGDVVWTVNNKWVSSKETLVDAMKSEDRKFNMTLRRFTRDESGKLVPNRDESGAYLLDSKGNLQWKYEEISVVFSTGKLGLKANYDMFLKQPFHRPD